MYNKYLHRFAFFTALCTFVLIFIGGLVTSTGSGLSVPDWPTTYGENMFTFPIDKWVGGIKYEHGHRLAASFVGFLTVLLAVWLAVKEDRKWVRWLGFYALAAVIIQGILGGLTVLFLLPTAVSVTHGMLAQLFFCMVASVTLFTSQWWRSEIEPVDPIKSRSIQLISIVASAAVFLQLGFGALLRHTHSGLAIPDFPWAYGMVIPDLSADAVRHYNQVLIDLGIRWPGDRSIAAYQIVIHLLHRYWAYGVAGIVFFLGFKLLRSDSLPKNVRVKGLYLIMLVVIQFSLGVLTVLSRKEYIITSFHVLAGAMILVSSVVITLQIARVRWVK